MKALLSLTLTASLAASSAQSDWSRVQTLAPGSPIEVRITDQTDLEKGDELFIDATADSITLLTFANRRIPESARKNPLSFAASHPELLKTIPLTDVVLVSRQITVRGPKPGGLSTGQVGAIVAGATLLAGYAVLAICRDNCSDRLLGGIAIGVPAAAGAWTAIRSSSHRETEIIYRAP